MLTTSLGAVGIFLKLLGRGGARIV
jgi:hypothetical protein